MAMLLLAVTFAALISSPEAVAVQQRAQLGQRLRHGLVTADSAKAQTGTQSTQEKTDDTADANDSTDDGDESGDDDDDDDDDDVEKIVVGDKVAAMKRKEKLKQKARAAQATINEAEILKWQVKVNLTAAHVDQIKEELADIADPSEVTDEINNDVKVVANETQSVALANFLGDMYKEMRQFASPFYKEHLVHEELPKAKKQHREAVRGLRKAETVLAKTKGLWRKEDNDDIDAQEKQQEKAKEAMESAKVQEQKSEAPKRAKTEAKTEAKLEQKADSVMTPQFTHKTMPGVSPTLQCVIGLCIQYFIIYGAWSILQTANNVNNGEYLNLQKAIQGTFCTVTYAPMLCVLFLATRMYGIQLAKGDTEKYGLPPWWVQLFMYIATWSVHIQPIIIIVQRKVEEAKHLGSTKLLHQLWWLQTFAANLINVSVVVVCIGAFTMQGPEELWHGNAPGPPPALLCVMLLTAAYFGVYLSVHFCETLSRQSEKDIHEVVVEATLHDRAEHRPATSWAEKLLPGFALAKDAVDSAPMLCILFLGARLRALQIDPERGNPQPWAQACFFICTWAVIIMAILTCAILLMDRKYDYEQKQMSNKVLRFILEIVRYAGLAVVFGCACGVIASVHSISSPEGPEMTPPISPAVNCLISLTQMYFFVYILNFFFSTFRSCVPTYLAQAQETARRVVMFAPMLCMLFIGARMRALQLARNVDGKIAPNAGPQGWVQESMYISCWCTIWGLVLTYVTAIICGTHIDSETSKEQLQYRFGKAAGVVIGIFLSFVKYLLMLGVFGGVVFIIWGICKMTPEVIQPYAGTTSLLPAAPMLAPFGR